MVFQDCLRAAPRLRFALAVAGFIAALAATNASALTYIEQFECLREPWGMPIPESPAALRRLDSLQRESAEPGGGRVFEYDGLTVWTRDVQADAGRVVVERIEITDPRWQWSSWANVGDTLDAALERLRWPEAVRGPKLEFGGEADSVALYVSEGRIVRIVYTCYAGDGG